MVGRLICLGSFCPQVGADADPERERDEKLSTLLGMVREWESRCKRVSLRWGVKDAFVPSSFSEVMHESATLAPGISKVMDLYTS